MCGPTETGLRAGPAHGSLGVNLWSRLMTDRIAQMEKPRPREAKGLGWGREQSTSETRVELLRAPHGAAFCTFPALVPGGSTLPATHGPKTLASSDLLASLVSGQTVLSARQALAGSG